MLKYVLTLPIAAVLSGPALLAQQPTWVENLFKVKTGRTHPAFEERVKQQRKAQEQARLERFSKLDKNKDGVINSGEWQNSGLPAALDADGNGSISMKEWMATPNPGSL
jgi:EF hand